MHKLEIFRIPVSVYLPDSAKALDNIHLNNISVFIT